nr:immunoglobulin light chain junction region [Macaca mulatta]
CQQHNSHPPLTF